MLGAGSLASLVGEARAADALERLRVHAALDGRVYSVEQQIVLTYKQRDCVVQYMCEVSAALPGPASSG